MRIIEKAFYAAGLVLMATGLGLKLATDYRERRKLEREKEEKAHRSLLRRLL